MGYLDTAGDLGSILADIAASRAQGRVTAGTANQAQDRNAMDAARLNLQAPSYRTRNAVTGDILNNVQDFQWGAPQMVGNIPVPTSTGGVRPSLLSPETRALGKLQTAQALQSARTNNGNVASVTPLPQAGAVDKASSLLGTAGTLAGALARAGQGSGGSIDLGKLFGGLFNRGGGTFGTPGGVTGNYNPADFVGIDPETGMPYADPTQDPNWQGPTQANDPNAGGLEDFYKWLDAQNRGDGGGNENDTTHFDDSGEW